MLFHTQLADVKTDGDRIGAIQVCNKAGLTWLSSDVFIDATGDAYLAFRSGVPCDKGREEDGLGQPMTMNLYNVDTQAIKDYFRKSDEQRLSAEFPRLKAQKDREP